MNKQQLASKIWESANKMRSKIEANEYKDYILGFMFYKFLSDKEVEYLIKVKGWSVDDLLYLVEDDEETVKFCKDNLGYFISFEDLFSTWLKKGKDFDVSNVRDALSAFNRNISDKCKKLFDRIFQTLETGLSKLGDSSGTQTKAISDLIHLIKDIPMDGKQDYDVLGFIYEYLISNFAANAGKKAGEFYTPHEVSLLMSEIVAEHLKNRENIEIYDPTSGSGSLLINIGHSVAKRMNDKNHIKYYAQELKENTYNLTRMNLVMRGILPDNICTRNGDTLEEDWPYFDESDPNKTYEPLYVDAVVSNPPYSQAWDPTDKDSDPRYKRFGLAPKTKADYAFLLHDLYHIKPDGIMTIVLPHGVLFRGGEEEKIRTNLVEENHIDAIIGLPANIFFGTGIPTIIMVLKQKRENTDTLIIDASKGFEKVGKNNKLRASDIKRIVDAIINREDIPKFCKKVSRETIRENGYNLNIPRYVDSSEKPESWDIYASIFGGIPMSEVMEMDDFWKAFPSLQNELFEQINGAYVSVKVKDINGAIAGNQDVVDFERHFNTSFETFRDYLIERLIANMDGIVVPKEEAVIAENIFARLSGIPLVDRYQAYQLLDNDWGKIATDLEIIQTEGFEATKKTDPKMVVKKKDGKDFEVQDGWIGHVIPFELVQKKLLSQQSEKLTAMENRLAEISSTYDEILDSLSEDDKEGDAKELLTEENDAFVAAAVSKKAKALKKVRHSYAAESLESKIIEVADLIDEEKELKKEIKTQTEKLLSLTKSTIESLTDEQVKSLLVMKWIEPICNAIAVLPNSIVSALENKINTLTKKYSVTMLDIESQIDESEKSLASMIDDLEGDEFDMLGLKELQKLLKGDEND